MNMKPETIARRRAERIKSTQSRDAYLIERLTDLAKRDGPDSIFAELLAEKLVRQMKPLGPPKTTAQLLREAADQAEPHHLRQLMREAADGLDNLASPSGHAARMERVVASAEALIGNGGCIGRTGTIKPRIVEVPETLWFDLKDSVFHLRAVKP